MGNLIVNPENVAAMGQTIASLSEQIGKLRQIQPSTVTELISKLGTVGDTAIVLATTTFSTEFGTSGWVYGIFARATSSRIDYHIAKQTGDFIIGAITISGSSYTISTKNLSGAEKNTGYTIAAKNGCTLNTAKLFWNGSLVTAYIDITIGSTIAIGTQIANGLPSPQGTYDNAVTAVSNSNSNDQIQAFTIDGYGDLKIAGKAATASRRYRMTFTYIVN